MITVTEALAHLFALAAPLDVEDVPLARAGGRVLARSVQARRTQPPFAASAMDGYAVRAADAMPGSRLSVIGQAAAGHRFDNVLTPGTAVRIFTGAPVPEGADLVVIQEDTLAEGAFVTITAPQPGAGANIRPAGGDFVAGATLAAPRRLSPADIAILAAMNIATVPVTRKPQVAIIATGDELVQPGEVPGPDQIIASNSYGLAALLTELGADPRLMPIARDDMGALDAILGLAQGADLVLTIGGASVGDHDLVASAAGLRGMELAFHKVAMRPGKPLMAGRMGQSVMLGLPGNPVSAMVCGHVFMSPLIRCMLGLAAEPAPRLGARLTTDLPANGPREHYLRARVVHDETAAITAFDRQDSSLLSVLSQANALLVSSTNAPMRTAGDIVSYIPI
jgi:molybdopterin molybdotransferase